MSGNLAEPGPIALLEWNDKIEVVETEYEVVSTFYFPGSKKIGRPKKIKLVAAVDDPGSDGAIRIYDLKNGVVIAEITNISNTTKAIIDIGNISNVPNNEAILEIQGEVVSGEMKLYSVALLF